MLVIPPIVRLGLQVTLATVLVGLSSTSPALAEDTCPNAAVRAQNNSLDLPDCRAYEMVSAPFKAGFPARLRAFSDEGIVTYVSTGGFADSPQGTLLTIFYHAERASAGWTTTSSAQSDVIYDAQTTGLYGESADLRQSLWAMSRRDVPGDTLGFWLRSPDGVFTRVGDASLQGYLPVVEPLVSDDLSHVVFRFGTAGGAFETALWEHVGTGNGLPRAVSVDNQGQPATNDSCPKSISGDGRVIVFSLGDGCDGGLLSLRARVGGVATVAVSDSECTRTPADERGACNGVAPALYAGAAADGSRVFFTTTQQLVNEDTDATNDLYACDIPAGVPAPVGSANRCASLAQVSGAASKAQVENAVAVSRDGSRVYFVAQGVLASNLGVGGVGASAGVPNLYLWERDGGDPVGQTRFVAGLGSSGNDLTRAQMTPDGRYLLFTTANPLVTAGVGADSDLMTDVYRYDADTPAIVRVSTSVAGGGANGGFGAASSARRSMTADGSTVIFSTAEALSRSDTNGVVDVYAWHDGHVSMISRDGVNIAAGYNDDFAVITPSGRDIYFTTASAVVAADGDASIDLYDARIGGGFEPAKTPPECSGDACQGQHGLPPLLTAPAPLALGNRDPSEALSAFTVQRVSAAQRKALARTGRVSLTVAANAAGTVTVRATAPVGGRSVAVAAGRGSLSGPGKVTVPVRLSKKARAQLADRGRLTVKVAVHHSRVALDRSVTLRLVSTKAKVSATRASDRRKAGARS